MKKSHSKLGSNTTSATLQVLARFSKEQKKSQHDFQKLLATKYTRSISSFGNHFRDTPEKKNTIFHQKVKSTLHRSNLSPIENVAQIFSSRLKNHSEEELLKDISDRFHVGKKMVHQLSMGQQYLNLIQTFKIYTLRVVEQLINFHQQKLQEYTRGVGEICKQYEQKVKNERRQTMREVQAGIMNGTSELGNKFMSANMKAVFSSKIFNEMELSGIDVNIWVANSSLMQKLIDRIELGPGSIQMTESSIITPPLKQVFSDSAKSQERNQERIPSMDTLQVLPISQTHR